jgi:predicted RNA-binding protein (virulence factor B family)
MMGASESTRTTDELLGHHATLTIRRFGSPGALLAVNEREEVLLFGPEIPAGAAIGDEVDVFLYLEAFKRAVGRLLKERSVVIGPDGTISIAPTRQPLRRVK